MTTPVVYVIGYTKCTQNPKIIPYYTRFNQLAMTEILEKYLNY
jgi:hypothetical protein